MPRPTLRPVESEEVEAPGVSEPELVPDCAGPRDWVVLEGVDVCDENVVVLPGNVDGVIVMRPIPVGLGGKLVVAAVALWFILFPLSSRKIPRPRSQQVASLVQQRLPSLQTRIRGRSPPGDGSSGFRLISASDLRD